MDINRRKFLTLGGLVVVSPAYAGLFDGGNPLSGVGDAVGGLFGGGSSAVDKDLIEKFMVWTARSAQSMLRGSEHLNAALGLTKEAAASRAAADQITLDKINSDDIHRAVDAQSAVAEHATEERLAGIVDAKAKSELSKGWFFSAFGGVYTGQAIDTAGDVFSGVKSNPGLLTGSDYGLKQVSTVASTSGQILPGALETGRQLISTSWQVMQDKNIEFNKADAEAAVAQEMKQTGGLGEDGAMEKAFG